MEISLYDTVFRKEDGKLIKFDIIVPSELRDLKQIYQFGNEFLKEEGIMAKKLISSEECDFCHMEIANEKIAEEIKEKGYSIFKHWGF
ncbi:MAG: DUF2024 family protein [Bacteroidia bacterium]|nr:DUF2024 family protein [Bacteroidia bacterium]